MHRIELGQYERDALNGLLGTMEFRNVATPTVDLLSDTTAMALVLSALELLGFTDFTDIDEEGLFGSIWTGIKDGVYENIEDANAAIETAIANATQPVNTWGVRVALAINWLSHKVEEAGTALQP